MQTEKKDRSWTLAWREAVLATWPDVADRPSEVESLLRLQQGLAFVAPEIWPLHAARAWEVYEDAEDEVVGRVAVALTYAICSPVRPRS